jgi:hypothetical protein
MDSYFKTWRDNIDHEYKGVLVRGWMVDQLEVCIEKLEKNPASRHALISFWNPMHDHFRSYCPCTLTWHFEIREGKLDMHSNIRSNDVLWGLPFDIFDPTTFQQVVAARLGVELGKFYQTSNNMHYYKRDYFHPNLIKNIIVDNFEIYDYFEPIKIEPMDREEMNVIFETLRLTVEELTINKYEYVPDNHETPWSDLPLYWRTWAYAICCDWYRLQKDWNRSLSFLGEIGNEWWLPLTQRLYYDLRRAQKKEKLSNEEFREMTASILEKSDVPTRVITEFSPKWKDEIDAIVR